MEGDVRKFHFICYFFVLISTSSNSSYCINKLFPTLEPSEEEAQTKFWKSVEKEGTPLKLKVNLDNKQVPNQPNLNQPNLDQPNLDQPNLNQQNLDQSNLNQHNLDQCNINFTDASKRKKTHRGVGIKCVQQNSN